MPEMKQNKNVWLKMGIENAKWQVSTQLEAVVYKKYICVSANHVTT